MNRRTLVIGFASIAFVVASAGAQSGSESLCWTARPIPRCGGWIITEIAYEKSLTSTGRTYRDVRDRGVLTLGGMVNAGERSAIGVVMSLTNDGATITEPARLELRYRTWAGGRNAYDFGIGAASHAIRNGPDHRNTIPAAGMTAIAGVSAGWIGIDARGEVLRSNGRWVSATLVGVRIGEKAAPLAVAGAAGLLYVLIAAFGGN